VVSHASKILIRIILERIRVKTETEIADELAGFRQGWGTRGRRQYHNSRSAFDRNYALILYRLRDVANYLSKVIIFPTHVYLALSLGVIQLECHQDLWHQKPRE